jgi:hypothetical protein
MLPTLCRAAAKHFVFGLFCYQPYAALRRSISSLHFSSTNLMPRCGEAFRFWIFLLRTSCRDPRAQKLLSGGAAAKHFVFGFFCYQPYAALRRSISFLDFSAKNLMPRCGERFVTQ